DAPALRELAHQVLDALLAPALELEELRRLEVEHVGRRADQAVLDELQDQLLAQALDLEGAAPAQEARAADELREAGEAVGAQPVLAGGDGGRAAGGTALRHGEALAPAPLHAGADLPRRALEGVPEELLRRARAPLGGLVALGRLRHAHH